MKNKYNTKDCAIIKILQDIKQGISVGQEEGVV
jgi:hypothetical protein